MDHRPYIIFGRYSFCPREQFIVIIPLVLNGYDENLGAKKFGGLPDSEILIEFAGKLL